MGKLYPDSKVEVEGLEARHYDLLMNLLTLGSYPRFLVDVIRHLGLQPGQRVWELGAGTGRNAELMMRLVGPDGRLTAWEIGGEMRRQFHRRFQGDERVTLENRRIDVPAEFPHPFDHAVISFVLHGLPHPNRLIVLDNVRRALAPGGWFHVLDYSRFDPKGPPCYRRWLFRYVECPLASDFVRRDWPALLARRGFPTLRVRRYFGGTVQLLSARRDPNPFPVEA